MSIVIIGGHERMERDYIRIGEKHGCKIKIFTKMPSDLCRRIGQPDYIVLFTDVASHKLVLSTLKISKKKNIPSFRIHNSSIQTLESALTEIKQ